MATAASLLTQIDAAIEALLTAIADEGVEEWQYNGQRYRRPAFAQLLDSLFARRDILAQQVSRSASGPVRLVGLRRPRA